MKQEALSALKKELEQNFGRKIISYRDCIQLVEDIYQKTGSTVNVNTVRRFFGLVKTNYTASRSTLLILSKYCGFSSPEEIEDISEKKEADTRINKDEILHYMISLFRHTSVLSANDNNFDKIIEQTILFLERNPDLIDKFQREIAKTDTGQYYYYEKSVNMDRLNSYYGKGLHYYLISKNTSEAKVFFYSIQVLKYWLTNNPELVEKNIKEIPNFGASKYHPHIAGRFFAANLYHANIKHLSIDHIWAEAIQYLIKLNKEQNLTDFGEPIYEALILTNHDMEANDWATYFKDTIHNINFINKVSNNFKRGNSKIPSKKTNDFSNNILSKKYSRLVSFALTNFSKRKKKSSHRHLNELIAETGFTRFSTSILS
jgi:hypothetical protein